MQKAPQQKAATSDVNHSSIGSVHLDALRGAAALMVFLNHTRALYFTSALDSFDERTSGTTTSTHRSSSAVQQVFAPEIRLASEAVIIFFVLSGYLVGGSVLKQVRNHRWSWRSYLSKRLTRLYLVLIPAIAIGAVLDHLGMRLFGPGSVYSSPKGIGIVTTFLLSERLSPIVALGNLFFVQDILVFDFGTNMSIWSLANEFWYYLIFPLLVLAFVKEVGSTMRVLYGTLAVLLFIFIGFRIGSLFPVWSMGAVLVLLPQRLTERQARIGTALALVLLLTVMAGVRLAHLRSIVADYLIASATVGFLFFAVQQRLPAKASIYRTISKFFSQISYSLYLFHLPIAVFLCGLVNSPWRLWPTTPMRLFEFIALDSTIVLIVYLLWRSFEANTDWVRLKLFEQDRRP